MTLTLETIQKTVAGYYGVTVDEMVSRRRIEPIATARSVAIYLAREHCKKVGHKFLSERFGMKDPSSVCYAIKRIERNESLKRDLAGIEGILHLSK